jgi:hypothetical protein
MAELTAPEYEDELTPPEYEDETPAPAAPTSVAAAPATAPKEEPGTIAGLGRGLIAGFPGATTLLSAIEAIGPKTRQEALRDIETRFAKTKEAEPIAYGTGQFGGIVGGAVAGGKLASGIGGRLAPVLFAPAAELTPLQQAGKFAITESVQAPLTYTQAREAGATPGEALLAAGAGAVLPQASRGLEKAGGGLARTTAEAVKDSGLVTKALSVPVRAVGRAAQVAPTAAMVGLPLAGAISAESPAEFTTAALTTALGAAGAGAAGLGKTFQTLRKPLAGRAARAETQVLEKEVRAPVAAAREALTSAEMAQAREVESASIQAMKDRMGVERKIEDLRESLARKGDQVAVKERMQLQRQIEQEQSRLPELAAKEVAVREKRANNDLFKAVKLANKTEDRAAQLEALGGREDAKLASDLRKLEAEKGDIEASVRARIAQKHGEVFGRLTDIDRGNEMVQRIEQSVLEQRPLDPEFQDMFKYLLGKRKEWTEPAFAVIREYMADPQGYVRREIEKALAGVEGKQAALLNRAEARVAAAPNYRELAQAEAQRSQVSQLTPEQHAALAKRFGLQLSDNDLALPYSLVFETERPLGRFITPDTRLPAGRGVTPAYEQQVAKIADLEKRLAEARGTAVSPELERELAVERAKLERRQAEDVAAERRVVPSAATEAQRKATAGLEAAGPQGVRDFVPATPEEQRQVELALQQGQRVVEGLEPGVRIPGEKAERPLANVGPVAATLGLLASEGARFNPNTLKVSGGWLRGVLANKLTDPANAREFLSTVEMGKEYRDAAAANVLLKRFDEVLRQGFEGSERWRKLAEKTGLVSSMLQAIREDARVRDAMAAP